MEYFLALAVLVGFALFVHFVANEDDQQGQGALGTLVMLGVIAVLFVLLVIVLGYAAELFPGSWAADLWRLLQGLGG